MTDKTLNERFQVRISEDDKQAFFDRCADLGRQPQPMLRELMVAFNERRLRIQISNDQLKSQQELYDVD